MVSSVYDPQYVASLIDHTNLRADATEKEIALLCEQAMEFGFHSVCVHSGWVAFCREKLAGSEVKISAVCGFPFGANATDVKAYEANASVEAGASEIDMVMNIGQWISGDERKVFQDIEAVVKATEGHAIVKVIIETALLSAEQIALASKLVERAGAHFVKTSTGYSKRGATVDDVRRIRANVSNKMGIKAAGGIRDWTSATEMIEAGATRIGTSSGPAIVSGASNHAADY